MKFLKRPFKAQHIKDTIAVLHQAQIPFEFNSMVLIYSLIFEGLSISKCAFSWKRNSVAAERRHDNTVSTKYKLIF